MKLTEVDIKNIAQSGEGYNAEFKINVPSKIRDLAGEVCAFANAAGGVILLGINDDNEIKGIEISNSKRSAIQNTLSGLNPHIHCPFYFVEVDGKQIAVIDIPSGLQKPYTVSGAIYIRQGANSQKLTSAEQMRDFFQQSGRIYFDEGSCNEFIYENDFDKEFFKEFRVVAGFSESTDNEQIIKNLKLLDKREVFKNGSVLFFGKKPESIFDKAVIRCVAFEGTDKVQIIDDKIWGGNLMQQYKEALQWLKTKLNVRYIIEGSGPRKEEWEIPLVALKEAIINALSHRDYYDKGGRIMIELFDDRLEITNPGGLVSSIKQYEFGTKSASRNPLIFGLFQRVNMVEQVGSGIKRIKAAILDAGLLEPIFKTEGLFTIVFRKTTIKEKVVANEQNKLEIIAERLRNDCGTIAVEVYNLMIKNSDITISELAKRINKSERTIEYSIAKLKKFGFIERIGPKLGGRWQVLIN